ncbi:polyprenyl synthetase family protein [Gilvimarinus sp. F26214L]|uniref:polyprenyl synthetase family protein n=1 Tax=Gilvimarinus sp. DZF01 TaxID=3461371 RepID=UPI0040464373
MTSIDEFLKHYQERSTRILEQQLEKLKADSPSSSLSQAVQYSLAGRGKRIRPVLAYASAEAVGALSPAVDAAACALECIHAYSLIHDDLPAMDDDDMRRGRPTCHIAFGEATAILAGDALLTLAFEVLAGIDGLQPATVLSMVRHLAAASGSSGMVGGQALDLSAVGRRLALPELETIHRYKTGALIQASVVLGALATETASPAQLTALTEYAACVGLAFQVQDDILDVTGSTEVTGKQQGADALRQKPTYVSLLGLEEARSKARQLHESALRALSDFDDQAEPLRALSGFIVARAS